MTTANKTPLYLSIGSFLLSSAAILFMPWASFEQEGGKRAGAYILALAFWLFFIMGLVFLRPVSERRKKDKSYRSKSGTALLRFFSNKPALVFDALLIAGIFVLLLAFIVRAVPGWITLAATFTAVFSLEMHGLFNGENYKYLCINCQFNRTIIQ